MLCFSSIHGIQITSLAMLCLVGLVASAQESNLQKWKNLDGREIEGQFQGADLEKGTVTILVPKVIPFKLLTKESVEMVKTLMKTKSQPASDASDTSVWINESYKTEIYRLDSDRWAEREIDSGKVVWGLKQLKKTDSFVELYNEVRKQTWRLYLDRSELKDGDGWKWLAKGHWKGHTTDSKVSQSESSSSTLMPDKVHDTFLEFEIEIPSDRRAHIHGKTNLPEGTELLASLESQTFQSTMGQSKSKVAQGGVFEFEPIGPESGFPHGTYKADVTMPYSQLQPAHVRSFIGDQGERLSGSLPRSGSLGRTIQVEKSFAVGNQLDAKKTIQETVEKAESYLKEVAGLKDDVLKIRNKKPNRTQIIEFSQGFVPKQQALLNHSLMKELPVSSELKSSLSLPAAHLWNMFSGLRKDDPKEFEKWHSEIKNDIEKAKEEIQKLRKQIPKI